MTLEISEEIVAASHLTLEEVRLGLAIWLFQEKRVSLGKCAQVAGLHKVLFQKELAKRKIQVHYTEEDFERDLKSAKRIV
jgi:predicted HTH domain antitoxin